MSRGFAIFLCAALACAQPLDIGARLELFVDDYLIESMRGVTLQLHAPRSAGTALAFDQPWEGNTSAYVTVFRDSDRYRMYYRGSADPKYIRRAALKPGELETPPHPEYTCYAESSDGVRWTKPRLSLYEFRGSKDNNIVWAGAESHNFAPFLDARGGYKALGRRGKGLVAFRSSDAIRWTKLREEPVITDGAFDSLNVAFWDSTRNHYVAIYRDFRKDVRTFKCATSKDFLAWTPGEWADFGGAPAEQLYTNATTPYFRAPHIFLAFPKRFLPDRTRFADMPIAGLSEAVFMSSRDGVHWDRRFMEAFIRPGRDERDWVHRNNMVAPNVVPTAPDEISLYVSRHYTYPSARVDRMALRTDGFVSVHAGFQGGELLTRPLLVKGGRLALNYATSAAGGIEVEFQDRSGNRLATSPMLIGDEIEREIPVPPRTARLRFVMKDADLYSIRFRE